MRPHEYDRETRGASYRDDPRWGAKTRPCHDVTCSGTMRPGAKVKDTDGTMVVVWTCDRDPADTIGIPSGEG